MFVPRQMQQASHFSDWVTLDSTVELGRNLTQGSDEFFRVGVFLVTAVPILIAKTRAERSYGRSDFLLAVGQFEIYLVAPLDRGEDFGGPGGLKIRSSFIIVL
jgi:hypothetical protein